MLLSCSMLGYTMICKQCGVELIDDNWYASFKKSYNYICKECAKKQSSKWITENKEKVRIYEKKSKSKRKEKNKENSKAYYHKRPDVGMWSRAKKRAIKKGIAFDIEVSDIVIPEQCPILGIILKVEEGSSGASSPSLDRIDPTKGYVKGNIWVISHKANTVKSDLTLQELYTVLKNIERLTDGN